MTQHTSFILGVPKKVLDPMNVEGLKRELVASHLHKYRLYLGLNSVVALGSKDLSYFRMGPLDGFGYFCTLTGPGRI
ncbi:two-component response regulator ARR18-like [Gossypium australe]|uniref:Two-component response regulator ARR18-like n=1 Tax=Gossypium australe TaxID=47621 RepID=A0A5B6UT39_9ROSI|nr:two-component response regulator ARR18-like [Gossypium australe]